MHTKTVWLCLLAMAVVALGAGIATASERAMTAQEFSGTFGACCTDDFINSQWCSKTNSWPCLSCLTAPAWCGIGREYSGNPIEECIDGTGGICRQTVPVDCYRNIPCTQTNPTFWDCKTTGGSCDIDLTTACVECTPGTPGPWIAFWSEICDE